MEGKERNMSPKKKKNGRPIFLTSTQAAELLNLSLSTLKKFIAEGKIRTIRTPGGHYRINKNELLSSLYKSSTPRGKK